MEIYLLRHGATPYTADGRYQGSHNVPLSEEGRSRLRRADFTPEVVYVSPLRRALESAAIVFPDSRLEPVQDLREMNFGVFEGRSPAQMEHDPEYRAWVDTGCLGLCPGGDSKDSFQKRVCAAFTTLADEALGRGDKTMVILAHGGVQMAIMERFALPRKAFWEWCGTLGGGYVLGTEHWTDDHTLRLLRKVRYYFAE